jgi:ferredoxin
MRSGLLKKIRVIVGLLSLLSVTAIFIDFRHIIPENWISAALFLQFTPSLLKFINLPVVASIGFLIVLLLTLATGRSYCSFLCPLGVLQDVVSRIGVKVKTKNGKFKYKKPYTILRYSILGATLIVMLAGSLFLVTILDPYSIFGRFMTYFAKPVAVQVNNIVAFLLNSIDIYTIYKVELKSVTAAAYAIPVLFLGLIGYLSFRRGRLFCNTVCPVGTLLGLISKVSVLRFNIDSNSCTGCGRCAVACKSSCIDFKNEVIDVSRCVTCFNCIDSCNDAAISFGIRRVPSKERVEEKVDRDKRRFIASSLFLSVSFAGIANSQDIKVPVPTKDSTIPEDKTSPVCPPGGISIDHFNDYCTACSLCIGACPTSVLQPSFREYGWSGIMQPIMHYHKGFCNFECTVCIDVCPSGAIMPLLLPAKKLTQVGKVKFIKENCIVETERTDCGACSEHCPTKAVKMVPFEGNLVIPEIEDEICIGCGACEYACPTKPYKAIFVNGNPIHLEAKKPKEVESNIKALEEFPF